MGKPIGGDEDGRYLFTPDAIVDDGPTWRGTAEIRA